MRFSRTEVEISRLDALAEELGSLQRLSGAHDAILNVTLNCLDAPVVFMRTKGLRALGQIINADPEVLRKVRSIHPLWVPSQLSLP